MRKRAGLWLAAVLLVSGVTGTGPRAIADPACTSGARVFGVAAETGHLVEIPSCPAGFGAAVEVDAGDWRGYHAIFAVRDGDAAILYAVTTSGVLWWRRQSGAGAGLGSPVQVGPSINWAQPTVFASRPGYLHVGAQGLPIRTFRHEEWSSGGVTVSTEPDLFVLFHGPSITALAADPRFAVGNWNGMNFRIWQSRSRYRSGNDDSWYVSGYLPSGLTSVAGDGFRLHAVNSAGAIVLLSQATVESPELRYGRLDTRPWQVVATSPGNYRRVVVPVPDSDTGAPWVAAAPGNCLPSCPVHEPWEWQSGDP